MLDLIQIGKRFKALREKEGLTQTALAEKLYVSHQAVSKWEIGISLPSLESLVTLTNIYHVSIDYLLCLNIEISTPLNTLFEEHSRPFIIQGVANGEINHVKPGDIIHLLTHEERFLLLDLFLKAHRTTELLNLIHRLSYGERRMIIDYGLKHKDKDLLQTLHDSFAPFEQKLIKKAGVL